MIVLEAVHLLRSIRDDANETAITNAMERLEAAAPTCKIAAAALWLASHGRWHAPQLETRTVLDTSIQ